MQWLEINLPYFVSFLLGSLMVFGIIKKIYDIYTGNKENDEERILGVAIKYTLPEYEVIQKLPAPFRHPHLFRVYNNIFPVDFHTQGVQGFYTNLSDFVTRKEALQIAIKTNALLKPTNLKELYSEDVWSGGFIDFDFNNLDKAPITDSEFVSVKQLWIKGRL